MMQLGIFAKTFSRRSLGETLDAVAAHQIDAIQFNMAVTGGPSLPAEIPQAVSEHVRAAVGARGLTMSAVSGTYNMAHPDPGVRSDGQAAARHPDRRRPRPRHARGDAVHRNARPR